MALKTKSMTYTAKMCESVMGGEASGITLFSYLLIIHKPKQRKRDAKTRLVISCNFEVTAVLCSCKLSMTCKY